MSRTLTLVVLKMALVAATATAQTAAPPRTLPAQQQTGQSQAQYGEAAQAGQADQAQQLNDAIAGCLLLGNQEEVALAQFAQSRAQNPKVKEFAQMMIRDHQQAIQRLQQIAPNVADVNLQGAERGFQADAAARPATNAAGAGGRRSAHEEQMANWSKSIAKKCLELTQKELGEKQGAEFDMAYIGQQCGAHIGMLAKLEGSRSFATGELQQVISDMSQTVEHHLASAKQIKEGLKSSGTGATAQSASDASRR